MHNSIIKAYVIGVLYFLQVLGLNYLNIPDLPGCSVTCGTLRLQRDKPNVTISRAD